MHLNYAMLSTHKHTERRHSLLRAAIVGWGAIGSIVGKAVLRGETPGIALVGVAEPRSLEEVRDLAAKHGFSQVESPSDLLQFKPHVVVETAGQEVLHQCAACFLRAGLTVIAMSAGALAEEAFRKELVSLAAAHGARLVIPSGAIGGLDMVRAAALRNVADVTITTIKPPEALAGAPYLAEHKIDLQAITRRTLIFDGFAEEAAKQFPKNLNVAVTLSLAGVGPARTRVLLYVDPAETRNVHEISLKGDFGEAIFTVAGAPCPDNPKTSILASLSAVATLRDMAGSLQIGS